MSITGNSLTWGYRVNKAVLVYDGFIKHLLTFLLINLHFAESIKPGMVFILTGSKNVCKPVFSHFRQKFTKIQAFLLPPSYKIVKVLFFGKIVKVLFFGNPQAPLPAPLSAFVFLFKIKRCSCKASLYKPGD